MRQQKNGKKKFERKNTPNKTLTCRHKKKGKHAHTHKAMGAEGEEQYREDELQAREEESEHKIKGKLKTRQQKTLNSKKASKLDQFFL